MARARLRCELCDRQPLRKERLGCGVAPRLWIRREGEKEPKLEDWSPQLAHELLGEKATTVQVRSQYAHANLGFIRDHLGQYWDRCPRWYAECTPPDERAYGDLICEALRAMRTNSLALYLAQGTPTAAAIEWIYTLHAAADHIMRERAKED
jgi:hypothetical protein